jgi:hypothetical protein
MKYYELYIPKEDAYHVVSKLAPHGFVEFLDATANNFHKPYYNSIRRCEEVIAKINQILKFARRFNIDLPEVPIVERVFEKHSQSTSSFIELSQTVRSLSWPSWTRWRMRSSGSSPRWTSR